MEDIKVINRFPRGIVTPPPSKSLGHRALICAALASLAGGKSRIFGLGQSEDISATLDGIRALGAEAEPDGEALLVRPGHGVRERRIDCGESGSTLRFLIPIAALDGGQTVFTGHGRLLERPMNDYAGLFSAAGIEFSHDENEVRVRGRLRGGDYALAGNVSSQFVSGMLMALPLAEGDSRLSLTTALESSAYVDMTLDVMKSFGIQVERPDGAAFIIRGGQRYAAADYTVEGDYSQAAFFLAAAALGRDVRCAGLNPLSRQGDRAMLDVLRSMGAEVEWQGDTVAACAGKLHAVTVDAAEIPDLVPVISALCCFCEGTSRIINAGRLRFKESDRLSAMAAELRALGADIIEGEDSLTINGAARLAGGRADAHGDHRVAMALAVAAIGCESPVILSGGQSVKKSYPGFWEDFEGAEK